MAETAGDENPTLKKDVVPSQYREKYKETGGTCGDFIAEGLSKVAKDGPEALASVKAENTIPAAKWKGMNPGMQRMNLANTLRAAFLRGDTIKILGREYNAKHQAEDFNGEVKDERPVLEKLAGFLGLQVNDRSVTSLQKLFFPPENKSVIAKAKREQAKVEREDAKAKAKAERDAAKAKRDTERAEAKAERDAARAKAKAEREQKKADEKKAKENAKAVSADA